MTKMTANGFSSYFRQKVRFVLHFTKDQATCHETFFFSFPGLNKHVSKGFYVLTSETSGSSDFKKPLGWGTTFRELKVLSKMATGFVSHATGVGDDFPGAEGAVKKCVLL